MRLDVNYNGGEEVGLTLYPRRSCLGTVEGFERMGWNAVYGRLPSVTLPNASFPMELSYLVDDDDAPDRLVLTLVAKQLADDDFPPHYSARINVDFYLTTLPTEAPSFMLALRSETFIHPYFETLHTPHGLEILAWEHHPGLRGNDFHGLTVWTIRPSGVFERTFGPVVSESVNVLDLDDDMSEEVVVYGTTDFGRAGSYHWFGRLYYVEDILTWDGSEYARAPASVAHPHVRSLTRDAVDAFLTPTAPHQRRYEERRRCSFMYAIETCLYWGVTDLGMELLDRYEADLRATGVVDEFTEAADIVIERWRAGSAVAGYAYGSAVGSTGEAE